MTGTLIAGTIISAAAATAGGVMSYRQGKAAADATKKEAKAQAEYENEQASIAQVQGEEEAAKRSRALSAEISSTYANWAGNGLSVSGSVDDTLGNVLKTQVAEGVADIDMIKGDAAVNVWSHQTNANLAIARGKNSAGSYRAQGNSSLATGMLGATGTALKGTASSIDAYNTYGWGFSKEG